MALASWLPWAAAKEEDDGKASKKKASFSTLPVVETREVQVQKPKGKAASGAARRGVHGVTVDRAVDGKVRTPQHRGPNRGVTLARLMTGSNLHSLVSDINTGERPNLDRLREKHLDGDSVIDASELSPVKVLGEGAFGIVWKCEYTPRPGSSAEELVSEAGGYVALKKLKLRIQDANADAAAAAGLGDAPAPATLGDRELSDFASELIMLKALKHPNVIGYIGATLHNDGGDANQLGIVQEFAAHGTLKPLVSSENTLMRPYSTADGLRWAHHVASGMAFLHDCHPPIIHRDLKPENILLCGDRCTAKIADFGLVTFERRGERNANYRMTGKVGSMRYMAPENYRGEDYDRSNDVYSFAIIMYELFMRSRAYSGQYFSSEEVAKGAAQGTLRPKVPSVWPAEAKEFVARCWHHDPKSRPDFKEIATTLAAWRNDEACTVLRGIAKGSKRGMLERVGFEKAMLVADYPDKHAKARREDRVPSLGIGKSVHITQSPSKDTDSTG